MIGETVQVLGAGRAGTTAILCCLDAKVTLLIVHYSNLRDSPFFNIIQKIAMFKEIKICNNKEV